MKRTTLVCCAALLALSACNPVDFGDLRSLPTEELCILYSVAPARASELRGEINRREAIDPKAWPLIDSKNPQFGMNPCEIEAIFGEPLVTAKTQVNNTHAETISFPNATAVFLNNHMDVFSRVN